MSLQTQTIHNRPSLFWLVLSFVIGAISIYGMIMVFKNGQEASYGISREVSWGLLIIGYSFLVGISAGTAILGSLSHVFKISAFDVMPKRVALVSLSALIGAFFIIFWELAGPYQLQTLRLLKYYTNFEITSPIWWMVTLYMIELPLLALELYFLMSKKHGSAFFASLVGLFVGVVAYSTLAFVFASNATRPLWHSVSFQLQFIVSAVAAGVAVVLMLVAFHNQGNRYKSNVIALNKTLFLALCLMFFVDVWSVFLNSYGGDSELAKTIKLFIGNGVLSSNFYYFELIVGIVLPIVMILIGKFSSTILSFIAGIGVLVGVFFSRYDNIVGGQLLSRPNNNIPFTLHYYMPTTSEISLFVGGIGVAMIVYFLGEKLFELKEEEH